MSNPKFETDWIKWKQGRSLKVDKDYADMIRKLREKPTVRYFKNVKDPTNQFQKSGGGTLSGWFDSKGQHTYVNKGNGEVTQGKSFVVGDGKLRLLPYDLIVR